MLYSLSQQFSFYTFHTLVAALCSDLAIVKWPMRSIRSVNQSECLPQSLYSIFL